MWFFSPAAGHFADALILHKWTVLSVRRLMTCLGLLAPGIFLLFFSAVNNLALAVMWAFHIFLNLISFTSFFELLLNSSTADAEIRYHNFYIWSFLVILFQFPFSFFRFVSLSMGLSACNSSGHLSNHADVAPNHAGITFAVSNTIVCILYTCFFMKQCVFLWYYIATKKFW